MGTYFTSREDPISQRPFNVATCRGDISGTSVIHKFGRSTNVDNNIATDVWDRANPTDDQDVWVAPTTARVHAIVSSDSGDAAAGAGAKTLQVYGLTSWSTAEVSETITMNGVTPVNTANSYVVIYRMKVLTKGATSSNIGKITATAATDSTVTAQIQANAGQTQMAIYAIPSGKTLYITEMVLSHNRAGAAASANVDYSLLVNPEPDAELTNFLVKETIASDADASSYIRRSYTMPKHFAGPLIVKIQAISTADNTDVSASFCGYIIDD